MIDFSGFKSFVSTLLAAIVAKCDAKNAELKTQVETLSNDLTTANNTITELQAAIASKNQEKSDALLAQAAEQLEALDQFSTDLAAQFNPTQAGDAVSDIVTEDADIPTPPEVAESQEVDTGEVTPAEVTEAAIEAVAVAAESSFE